MLPPAAGGYMDGGHGNFLSVGDRGAVDWFIDCGCFTRILLSLRDCGNITSLSRCGRKLQQKPRALCADNQEDARAVRPYFRGSTRRSRRARMPDVGRRDGGLGERGGGGRSMKRPYSEGESTRRSRGSQGSGSS